MTIFLKWPEYTLAPNSRFQIRINKMNVEMRQCYQRDSKTIWQWVLCVYVCKHVCLVLKSRIMRATSLVSHSGPLDALIWARREIMLEQLKMTPVEQKLKLQDNFHKTLPVSSWLYSKYNIMKSIARASDTTKGHESTFSMLYYFYILNYLVCHSQ